MKTKFLAIILLVLSGCSQDVRIDPRRLIGTWTAPSGTGSNYLRWTFDRENLYMATDTVQTCEPVQPSNWNIYHYWIEENTLVLRFAGISYDYMLRLDIRRPVESMSPGELILATTGGQPQTFTKCP